jgi:hypothetical protein
MLVVVAAVVAVMMVVVLITVMVVCCGQHESDSCFSNTHTLRQCRERGLSGAAVLLELSMKMV